MAEFDTFRDYWTFRSYVTRTSRYILDDKNRAFLGMVAETSEKRKFRFSSGATLWRAQLGCDWREDRTYDEDGLVIATDESPVAFSEERMRPRTDRAFEGRVNPKGIPCLYLSTERDTAMAETRPWIDSFVSVAQCVVVRDVTLVDCSAIPKRFENVRYLFRGNTTALEREECVWRDINRAFSEPVARTDDAGDYAPTQLLAESFRRIGFDGVFYGSRLGTGKTVALFDLATAQPASVSLFQVKSLDLRFDKYPFPDR